MRVRRATTATKSPTWPLRTETSQVCLLAYHSGWTDRKSLELCLFDLLGSSVTSLRHLLLKRYSRAGLARLGRVPALLSGSLVRANAGCNGTTWEVLSDFSRLSLGRISERLVGRYKESKVWWRMAGSNQ